MGLQYEEVLLVEDNPADAALSLRALRSVASARHLHHAEDGQRAVDFIFGRREFAVRDTTRLLKAVFLDIKLPKLDGMEVLRQIKGDPKTRAIPVIMLTSSGEDRDIRESYELGANSYVVKPVNFEDYQSKVAAVARYWTSFNRARHGWAFVS